MEQPHHGGSSIIIMHAHTCNVPCLTVYETMDVEFIFHETLAKKYEFQDGKTCKNTLTVLAVMMPE
jgi:hypothetical protein